MSPRLADALLRSQSDERLRARGPERRARAEGGLVALAQEGSERAFTTLVERHRKPLLAFAGRLVGTERAEDVVQQALLQAWAALQRGAKVGHTRGWLHQIVRHAAFKATARAPGEAPLPAEVAAGADPIAALEQRLEASDLLAAMQALPDRQREAIVQTALEGRSRE